MFLQKPLSALSYLAVALLICTASFGVTASSAQAQVTCPNGSVRTNQVGRYAYNTAERNVGGAATCTSAVAIPSDGIRVYSSWRDCRSGNFILRRESASGAALPISLNCPNCARTTAGAANLAPGTSSGLTAFFRFPDGAIARYTATIARSAADIQGRYICSISNAQVSGSAFGGAFVAPTANAGADQPGVASGAVVTLDGSGSSDGDGSIARYAWTRTGGTGGAVTLSDAAAVRPTFTADTLSAGDAAVTHIFSLVVTDNLGLTSPAETVTITVTSGPTVLLSGEPASITNTDTFTVTATFSKDVTGFDQLARDVTVINGSVSAITGGPAIYTLTIAPAGNGDVSIIIPTAAARDSVGNPNWASNTLEIVNQIVEITQGQIAGFMLGRANNVASNQPTLTRFLTGEGCGGLNANANEAAGSINACVSQGNTWAAINSAWSGTGSYTLGTFGAHGFVNPDLLIGGMVQFDYTDDPANNASGSGWMIGPYFVARLPEQPLYFEGRLLYGQTHNDISPLGTYTDSFETERWLVQLRTTGEYQVQTTKLMPLLDFTYTEDSQQAYTDSLGNTISGQTVSLMQLSVGLDFSQPLPATSGTLELAGGLSGIYSSSKGAAATPEFESWRARTHLGLTYDTGTGAKMEVGGFYDGIGSDYESYGVNLGFDWRF